MELSKEQKNEQLIKEIKELKMQLSELESLKNDLAASKKELSITLNTVANGIRKIDNRFIITMVNEPFLQMVNLREDQVIGKKCYDIFSSKDCHTENCTIIKHKKNPGIKHENEVLKIRPDSLKIDTILASNSTFDNSGVFNGIIEDFKDITEQKTTAARFIEANEQFKTTNKLLEKTSQELTDSNKKLQTEIAFSDNIIETANSIIIGIDTDANITIFNKYAEHLTSYSKEEVIGKNWFDLFIPESNQNMMSQVFLNVLKEMPDYSSFDNSILCKDRTQKVIRWKNSVLKDVSNEKTGVISIGEDITERRKAKILLQESEEKYRLLAENSMDIVWKLNPKGEVMYISNAILGLTGYSPKEIIGTNISNYHTKETLYNLMRIINTEYSKGIPHKGVVFESKHLHKKGHEIPIEIVAKIIYDDFNQVNYIQGHTRNITERNKSQKLLKARLKELEIFYDAAINREIQINDTRKEVNQLLKELGKERKYKIIV